MVIVLQQLHVKTIYSEATKFLLFCKAVLAEIFLVPKPVLKSHFWLGVISHTQALPNLCSQDLLQIVICNCIVAPEVFFLSSF